ncbi:MAG: hypothetical protein DMG37_23905, partial [Acidobacteria bacterium]
MQALSLRLAPCVRGIVPSERGLMKDLVVGAAANLSWNELEPWIVSLERSGYTGQKAIIAYNLAPGVMQQLTSRGFYIKHIVRQDR